MINHLSNRPLTIRGKTFRLARSLVAILAMTSVEGSICYRTNMFHCYSLRILHSWCSFWRVTQKPWFKICTRWPLCLFVNISDMPMSFAGCGPTCSTRPRWLIEVKCLRYKNLQCVSGECSQRDRGKRWVTQLPARRVKRSGAWGEGHQAGMVMF